MIHPLPDLLGRVNGPTYVAPAASVMVSPSCAMFSAAWKSPPAPTAIVRPPWAGIDVSTVARGSSGRVWANAAGAAPSRLRTTSKAGPNDVTRAPVK